MRRGLVIIAFIQLCFGSLLGQQKLSLEEAIRTGLNQNYQILLAEKNAEIAENNNDWGETSALPKLSLSGSNSNSEIDNSNNPNSVIRDNFTVRGFEGAVAMDWVLFNGLNSYVSKQKLEALAELSEGNEVLIIENTVQAIMLAYYSASLQKELLASLRTILDLSTDRMNYVNDKFELGAATTFDVLQDRTALLNDSTNYLLQKLNYENAIRNLNLLMASPIESTYELTTTLELPVGTYSLDAMRKKMVGSNRNLQNQFINNYIAQRDIKIAQSRLYPTIALKGGYNGSQSYFESAEQSARGSATNYYANFTLAFNLFDGGKVRRGIQNAKIQEEMSLISTEELKLTLDKDLISAYELYKAQLQICLISEANMKDAALNLEIGQEKYKNGVINSFNFRDIQNNYVNVSISRLRNIFDALSTEAELLRLTGGIMHEK